MTTRPASSGSQTSSSAPVATPAAPPRPDTAIALDPAEPAGGWYDPAEPFGTWPWLSTVQKVELLGRLVAGLIERGRVP